MALAAAACSGDAGQSPGGSSTEQLNDLQQPPAPNAGRSDDPSLNQDPDAGATTPSS